MSHGHGGQGREERFPQAQKITCINLHMNMYGDKRDLLYLREAPRDLPSLLIDRISLRAC